MKRYAIIGLLMLLIGAFVLVPLLKNSGEDPSETVISSTFNFKDHLETTFAKAVPIAFTVNVASVKKVELIQPFQTTMYFIRCCGKFGQTVQIVQNHTAYHPNTYMIVI